MQRTLNARLTPSPNLDVDGDFGSITRDAVIRFQRERGLPPLGSVDARTREALGTPPPPRDDRDVPPPSAVNTAKVAKEPPDPLDGPPYVGSKAVVIVDGKTGEVVWGKDEARVLEMASTTKMTTALIVGRLAAKDSKVLDEIVTFSKRADDTSGSTSGVRAGERLPVRELLYGLLLPSGNDAATAVAEHFGGRFPKVDGPSGDDPLPRFIAEMNRVAEGLKLKETHYANPHGLPAADHHSSARDLARLARFSPTRRCAGCGDRPPRRDAGGWRGPQAGRRLVEHELAAEDRGLRRREDRHDRWRGVVPGGERPTGRRPPDRRCPGRREYAGADADVRNLFRWAWRRRGHHD